MNSTTSHKSQSRIIQKYLLKQNPPSKLIANLVQYMPQKIIGGFVADMVALGIEAEEILKMVSTYIACKFS